MSSPSLPPFTENYDDYLQTSEDEFADLENRSFQEQQLIRSAAERDPRQYRGIGYGGLTGEEKAAVEAAGMNLPQNLVARENVQQKYRRAAQAKGFGFDKTPAEIIAGAKKKDQLMSYDDMPGGAPGEGAAPTGQGMGISALGNVALGFGLSLLTQTPTPLISRVVQTIAGGFGGDAPGMGESGTAGGMGSHGGDDSAPDGYGGFGSGGGGGDDGGGAVGESGTAGGMGSHGGDD